MAKLNTNVHVIGDDGVAKVYGPEDGDLPDDVAEKITNPDVWEGDAPDHVEYPTPGPGQTVFDTTSEGGAAAADDPLMKKSKDDLQTLAGQWDVDFEDSDTKATLVAGIRAAGYDGDGTE